MNHIIGSTFDRTATYFDTDGLPIDITNINIQCQIRTLDKTLLSNVVITKLVPANGTYRMVVENTSNWIEGEAVFDIRYSRTGHTDITDSIKMVLIDSITKPI
jgi:hypothetical protein